MVPVKDAIKTPNPNRLYLKKGLSVVKVFIIKLYTITSSSQL